MLFCETVNEIIRKCMDVNAMAKQKAIDMGKTMPYHHHLQHGMEINFFRFVFVVRVNQRRNSVLNFNSLFCFFFQVYGSGLFELRLKYFKNDYGKNKNGICCSGQTDPVTNQCIGTCKTRFRVCLKHYQTNIDPSSPCTFGDVMTPIVGENSMNLTALSEIPNFVNPIQFPFDFTWPVSKNLIFLHSVVLTQS